MGTPRFGAIVLEKLAQSEFKPILVITEPDKPAGRKQELKAPECKIIAEKYNIPVVQPEKIKNLESGILKLEYDLIIVAAYGQIIPKNILEIPKYGCLNVHPSLLSKYRGPSPIQYAILNRDKETGITIILMDEKVDHGPIVAQQQLEIPNSKHQIPNKSKIQNPNYETLETELAKHGADLLIKTIPNWISKRIKAEPQNESKATLTKIIKKEDGKIDWKKPAEAIEAQIRAFHVWPGTFFEWNGKKIKILEAETKELPNKNNYDIGEVIVSPAEALAKAGWNKILVKCGQNFLIINKLQLEGKKPTNSEEFLRGHKDFIGTILK